MNMKDQLRKVLEKIDGVVGLFYQQQEKEGYKEMQEMIEDIAILMDGLYNYAKEEEYFNYDHVRLVEGLTEAMNALEDKDTILLADVLQYELAEQLKLIEQRI